MTLALPVVFMQAAPAAQPSPFTSMLPMIVILGFIMYFFMWRPQKAEEKAHNELLAGLQRGDKVVTSAGVHGKVHEVRPDAIVIEISANAYMTVDREAVKRKVVEKAAEKAPEAAKKA